jgi:tRNA uridine 5-carboxymethylaminomethyl modification enzyme
VSLAGLLRAAGVTDVSDEACVSAEVEIKYTGYLAREREAAARLAELDGFRLPAGLRYDELGSISYEAREKLSATRPATIGQAGRIPGVSPSDLQNLVIAVLRFRETAVSRETAS